MTMTNECCKIDVPPIFPDPSRVIDKKSSTTGRLIAGLDIGASAIRAIVGCVTDNGIEIVGVGSTALLGGRPWFAYDVEKSGASIRMAVEEAERMAGCTVTSAYVGISGGHIKGFNSQGITTIDNLTVSVVDLKRVMADAIAITIPTDREVIHAIPRSFFIDDQDGIRDPLGMSGSRLKVQVHVVTGESAFILHTIESCRRANLEVTEIVLKQLASSEAVLSAEEKKRGVVHVDMGGGTTDIAIFSGGAIAHTAVFDLGGKQLTNDIAATLRIPMKEAEKLKLEDGCCLFSRIAQNETIDLVSRKWSKNPRFISRWLLVEIIEPWVRKLFHLINREIFKSGYEDHISAGVVITGGFGNLEGILELGEQLFKMPVRRGVPVNISGPENVMTEPEYATGVGLVVYGAGKMYGRTKFAEVDQC